MKNRIKIYLINFFGNIQKRGSGSVFLLGIVLLSLQVKALPATTFLACNDTSPKFTCASVSATGDVTLTWLTPTNTGIFDSYHIFKSNTLAGPYTVLDSIFVAGQTTYTHVAANANTAAVYYYIQTRCSGSGFSPPLDTIHSIFLNAVNPANGTAALNWKANKSTGIATYSVYKKIANGAWNLIGTKNNPAGNSNMSYIDTVLNCNANISYKVELTDISGCLTTSSVSGGTFQNTIAPASPLLDTLSVDDNNLALMSWEVSSSTDVQGYVIYQFNGASWVPVDSILGINNTSFNYPSSIAGSKSEQYRLAAFDSCGNISLQGAVYSTIFLTAAADICKHSAMLSWTAYPTFKTGLSKYLIYQSSVGLAGPYVLIDSVNAGVVTYTATGLNSSTMYYYKITAKDNSGTKTASSNRIPFYSATPVPPQFLYLQKISVRDPNQVDLTCHIDLASPSFNFKIMRSSIADSAHYVQIGSIGASTTNPILFSDNNVSTDLLSYYYKVINVDSCGNDGMESNVSRTILLTVKSSSDSSTNTLTWNDYEGWSGGVSSYNVYRSIDGVEDPSPIANIPFSGSGWNTYTDDVSELLQGQGVFSYYIEAVEGPGNTFGFNETSLSNIAEGYQDSKIFIPNAFFPDGIFNPVFKPVTTYVETSDYVFRVFNRMGLQMFTTTDLAEGWDGTNKGTKCEFGVYVYLIHFKTSRGEYIDLKGSLTLLR